MAGGGLFGSPDSIERLAHALCGPKGNGGTTNVVREVRDQASHIANDLVPNEWRGPAAGAFLQMLSHRDVPDLTALSEATSALGAPLIQLALDIRAANRLADDAKELVRPSGFDIDSNGHLSSDLLHSIEHDLLPGSIDPNAVTMAQTEMIGARHLAEQAWDAARHALASVQVPRIGTDTLQQAEHWGFSHAAPPWPDAPPGRGTIATWKPPTQPRSDPNAEDQRIGGINFVQQYCGRIVQVAAHYGVPAVAIAGAILWEAVEDPHGLAQRMGLTRGPGPGKVHFFEIGPDAAEQAENDGKIPKSSSLAERWARVQDPDWAINYIGAILSDSADRYKARTARRGTPIDISGNVGVLLTFYEGVDGGPEGAADKDDLRVGPKAANDMGPWVVENLPWVKAQLTCLD